jgi:hypothetical protein
MEDVAADPSDIFYVKPQHSATEERTTSRALQKMKLTSYISRLRVKADAARQRVSGASHGPKDNFGISNGTGKLAVRITFSSYATEHFAIA